MAAAAPHTVTVSLLCTTAQFEAAMAKAGLVADKAGMTIGDAFTRGTDRAGGAITNLANKGAALGLPLTGSLAKVGQALDQATTKTSKLSTVMGELGKATVIGGLAAFAAAAYEGVKGAAALQQQMEMIHTQAGASQQEVKKMTGAILGMASSVGTAPQQLAEALYHVESAGYRGAQALDMLNTAAKGAKIGNANLTDTAQALAAAVFSNIPGAQNLNQAMGLLNATVGAGDMTMQQLNESFQGPMLATVKGYGLSLKDVGAALADFGDLNIRGADAATQLRMAVQYMAKPAATAGPYLEKLGLNVHSFSDALANGGLLPALQLLKQRFDAIGVSGNQMAADVSDLFTKKGSAGVTILLNSLDRLQQKYTAVQKGSTSFSADWTATTKNLSFEWSQVTAGAIAFADKLGGYLIPKIQQLGSFVANNKGAFEDLAKVIGVVLGGAVAVFVGQKVVAFVGGIARMVASLEAFILKSAASQAAMIAEDGSLVGVGEAATAAASKIDRVTAALTGLAARAALPIAVVITIAEIMKPVALSSTDTAKAQTPQSNLTQLQSDIKNKVPYSLAYFNDMLTKSSGYAKGEHYAVQNGRAVLIGQPKTANPLAGLLGAAGGASSGGGSGSSNPFNSVGGSTTASTALTKAMVALEDTAIQFNAAVKTASAGGTSFSQQGRTVARLRAATGGTNPAQEAALVASLNATGNPTLEKMASTIESTWAAATSKLSTIIDNDTKAGQSELTKLQNAANTTSFASLKDAVTGTAATSFHQLVTELTSVHMAMAKQLEAQWAVALGNYNSVLATLATTAQADALELIAAKVTAQATQASNIAGAATGISGLGSTASANQINAASQALTDAAKIMSDQSAAQTQAITDAAKVMSSAAATQIQAIQAQTTAMTDTANAQIAAINDQTQTQVDTLAEKGLFGLNLQAQLAKVALDQQKAIDDQLIAASQAHLDQVTAQTNAQVALAQYNQDLVAQQTNAQVAQAQMNADLVAQATNASTARAQASADQVAITGAIAVAAAQATADNAAVTAAINNAAAQAHTDAEQFGTMQQQQEAAASQKLIQGQSNAATTAANASLSAAQSLAASNNQDAQNAYAQQQAQAGQQNAQAQSALAAAQAWAAMQQALAAAQLSTLQSNATTQQALAQQQLTAVQTASSIAEAKLQSTVSLLTEMANVEFKGTGAVINIYGLPANDASAIVDAASWEFRSLLTVPA